MRGPWPQRSALIIDEISILGLKMFATIDQQFVKAKGLLRHSDTVIFGGLSLILLMGRLLSVYANHRACFMGKNQEPSKEKHGKQLWESLTAVITLTQQMRAAAPVSAGMASCMLSL